MKPTSQDSDPSQYWELWDRLGRLERALIFPRCRVRNGADASVGSASWTTLGAMWDTEEYDVFGMHDTSSNQSRIVVPFPGFWEAKVQLVFGQTGGAADITGQRSGRIWHHRAADSVETMVGNIQGNCSETGNYTQIQVTSGDWPCAAGDWFYAEELQDSGSTLNLKPRASDTPGCWFEVKRVPG